MLDIIAIIAPFFLYLLIAIYDYNHIRSITDYFLAGRQLSTTGFVINASVTNYSFLTLVFVLSYWGVVYGSAAWWNAVTMIVGFGLFCVKVVSPTGQQEFLQAGDTVNEFLGLKYQSPTLRTMAALITALAYLGYFIASIYIAATFFAPIIGIGKWLAICLFTTCITLYTILGGYKSVVKTDEVQFLLIIAGCIILLYTTFQMVGVEALVDTALNVEDFLNPAKGIPYIVALFLLNGLWQLFALDMWQRTISTGDGEAARWGAGVSALIWSAISIPVVLMGVAVGIVAETGVGSPTQALHIFIEHVGEGWALAVLYMSLVGAFISSQDSNLAALTQTLFVDVLPLEWDLNVTIARWTVAMTSVLGIALLYALIQLVGFNLVSFLLTFFSAQLVLLPSLLIAFRGWHVSVPSNIPVLSIAAGFFTAFLLGMYSLAHPVYQFWTPIISLAVAVIPFVYWFILGDKNGDD